MRCVTLIQSSNLIEPIYESMDDGNQTFSEDVCWINVFINVIEQHFTLIS